MNRFLSLLALGLALWASPALAVDASTALGDANYTMTLTDQRLITTTVFTAPRTLTLIGAGATCIGQTCGSSALEIVDLANAITGTNTLTIAPQTGDTINGSASSFVTKITGGRVILFPLSGTNWYAQTIGLNGQAAGTTTNDNACVGCVGEVLIATGTSAPLLTSTVPATVQSGTLTAGDWECRGSVNYVSSGGAATVFSAWTSTTAPPAIPNPAVVNNNQPSWAGIQMASVTSPAWVLSPGVGRYSLAASTSIFLAAAATFSSGTPSASGDLQCRRVR